MNIIINKLNNNQLYLSLVKNVNFNASKMQASSTQNTKDSAGKRLGYKLFII